MSLGWTSSPPPYNLSLAVGSAWNNGKLLIAAAGNVIYPSGSAGVTAYAAAFSQVIGVAGVDSTMKFARGCPIPEAASLGSRYGSHVMLSAPFYGLTTKPSQTYLVSCGTSLAAPYVAGVAALLWTRYPSWTNRRLYEHLLASALDRPPTGWDDSTGYGIVQATLTDVFAPPAITATIQTNRPRLTWNVVPAAGSYRVYRKVNPDVPSWTLLAATTSTSYTDWSFWASSFHGYNTNPADPSASYYVVAVSLSGIESQFYSSHATFLGELLQ